MISTISLTLSAATVLPPAAEAQRVRFCVLCAIEDAPTLDTLCSLQERVVRSPADAAAVKALPQALQRRLLANDVRWRCKCENWQNPACAAPPAGP